MMSKGRRRIMLVGRDMNVGRRDVFVGDLKFTAPNQKEDVVLRFRGIQNKGLYRVSS
jgi:hypothetical protein